MTDEAKTTQSMTPAQLTATLRSLADLLDRYIAAAPHHHALNEVQDVGVQYYPTNDGTPILRLSVAMGGPDGVHLDWTRGSGVGGAEQ